MLSDCCLSCLSVCPVLSACNVGVLWPNGWMDQGETWRGGRPRPRPHSVRWGPSSPRKKGHSPQVLAHVCCGQTTEWIKMRLRTKVGLGPGHTVLDGDPALPTKGHNSPTQIFGPNGWMDQDATWYRGMPPPRPHCVRWGPSCPTQRGTTAPTVRPMFTVSKRSPISATAELLLLVLLHSDGV